MILDHRDTFKDHPNTFPFDGTPFRSSGIAAHSCCCNFTPVPQNNNITNNRNYIFASHRKHWLTCKKIDCDGIGWVGKIIKKNKKKESMSLFLVWGLILLCLLVKWIVVKPLPSSADGIALQANGRTKCHQILGRGRGGRMGDGEFVFGKNSFKMAIVFLAYCITRAPLLHLKGAE